MKIENLKTLQFNSQGDQVKTKRYSKKDMLNDVRSMRMELDRVKGQLKTVGTHFNEIYDRLVALEREK